MSRIIIAWSGTQRCLCVLTLLAIAAPPPAADLPPSVEPIRFARGASSAELKGAVIRGERALYSFDARQGQQLSAEISSAENNAVFQIYKPGARAEMRDGTVEIAGEALPRTEEGTDTKK